jgi:serine/threonine protein phosphatase PrpC
MPAVWRHIAQCQQGRRHSADGTACQDNCLVRVIGDELQTALVACVADGAGSSACSEIGSRLACESILASAESHFESNRSWARLQPENVLSWCEAARRKISDFAQLGERRLREYATTLCAAVVSDQSSVFFQIGDGAIVARRHAALGVVFWPQSGEYANTTSFLTSDDFDQRVQVLAIPGGFSDLALFTDGLERLVLKFDSQTPHAPFFQPLFQALRQSSNPEGLNEDLRQLLQSDPVRNKTDDDKTLILASRLASQTSEPG